MWNPNHHFLSVLYSNAGKKGRTSPENNCFEFVISQLCLCGKSNPLSRGHISKYYLRASRIARSPLPSMHVGLPFEVQKSKGAKETVLITLPAFKWEQSSAARLSWPDTSEPLNCLLPCCADMATPDYSNHAGVHDTVVMASRWGSFPSHCIKWVRAQKPALKVWQAWIYDPTLA